MTLVAARRPVRTYVRNGRDTYADTGRAVAERLGSHVVLWIVEDPEAWACAIEAEGDAELTLWGKKNRGTAEHRRNQRYESAAQVRVEGACRSWRGHYHDAESAEASAAELRRSHPNPGVRYSVAEITAAGACPDCHQPIIQADGEWRHHALRYPAECISRPETAKDEKPERVAGEWEIDIGRGSMICGYCNEEVWWTYGLLGYVRLNGYHTLGIEKATGELVVMAEGEDLKGRETFMPHHCEKIPDDVKARFQSRCDEWRTAAAAGKEA